jgi:hypothetical protein
MQLLYVVKNLPFQDLPVCARTHISKMWLCSGSATALGRSGATRSREEEKSAVSGKMGERRMCHG